MRIVTRTLVAATVGALSVSALTISPHFATAQTGTLYSPGYNLLINPGHEHPGTYFAGRGEINVTWGWIPFWEEAPPGVDPRDPYYR
ncbi:MAG: hypothetical protein NZM18_08400, partial [Thermoflexales bacterium]|nr:hypothetical protein [Thermoflexales bacterium]